MPPLIALLSDFGTRDHYAGTMKGVILGIAPDAVLVDLTHEVPAHDVLQGALQLAAACPFFPAGTIFLSVVDPGVGTTRRAIAVAANGQHFVAPDNGLLTAALRDVTPRAIVELSDPRYARPTVSRTFEGRDRFAPAAAWLARGVAIEALGRSLSDYQRLAIPVPAASAAGLRGTVLFVDHFGNLVTNIDRRTCERFADGHAVHLEVAGGTVARIVETYAEIPTGEICALYGSTDHLELAAHAASAADRLGVSPGQTIEVRHGR